jgi:hypothetical protein
LAQRSRKPRGAAPGPAHARPAGAPPQTRASRSEARDAAARARLEPLAPGERPAAVTVAAIVALGLAAANLVLFAVGYRVKGAGSHTGSLIVFEALLLTAAAGLWRARYWAVLGFETLLGLIIVFTALSLVVASNLAAVALCLGIAVPASLLFYKLIRAMARIQTPERAPEP